MKDNILNQAEHFVNLSEAKIAIEKMKDFIPTIVDINKSVYDEMKKKGFTADQAFKFSCDYTLKCIFQEK